MAGGRLSAKGFRESLLSFIGGDLVAARWKQWRYYFTDIHPTGSGPQRQPGFFSASTPLSGYPYVPGGYGTSIGSALEGKATLARTPDHKLATAREKPVFGPEPPGFNPCLQGAPRLLCDLRLHRTPGLALEDHHS